MCRDLSIDPVSCILQYICLCVSTLLTSTLLEDRLFGLVIMCPVDAAAAADADLTFYSRKGHKTMVPWHRALGTMRGPENES